ncbi:helix-turn-helix domain-containing protein [Xenorhabdus griffiniae]|uniref:Helix-turn-helix domain-containing protein n=1 Tax=Xenorhabdus griffiniae TaxID=351672 RepID=A0ABY9XMK3_9GAMM|nr:helix-turn-helix domain-containing protein [Xenorhabdus griffiniae]MBD1228197.1 helix-turn-helix domain-containing protein [Xenorhabdus griffiniae]MBE8588166.1 helix-turn-helix domain-containing protein [Xenorhabdus griffiniae]MDC9606211.1 helix-turn-helix domain-containing protein [Xenorhabdus griffiniae]WMV74157.1 helix-turn-helix domain-containing protein [Xenorhabdus griffiniae]WNH03837.1 helix-turn-helix domain-containing protein [Xenorhabdus griffiniae]
MLENVINDIVRWLESQLQQTEGIKIDAIAHKSGYSKWHLQRIFKELKGCTLGQYVRRRRLHEAARSLREGNLPILDIALQYGFSSQATFTRIFKRHFNTTPAKFRENGYLPELKTFLYCEEYKYCE